MKFISTFGFFTSVMTTHILIFYPQGLGNFLTHTFQVFLLFNRSFSLEMSRFLSFFNDMTVQKKGSLLLVVFFSVVIICSADFRPPEILFVYQIKGINRILSKTRNASVSSLIKTCISYRSIDLSSLFICHKSRKSLLKSWSSSPLDETRWRGMAWSEIRYQRVQF